MSRHRSIPLKSYNQPNESIARAWTNKNGSGSLFAFPVTNLKTIAAGILEEDGVVVCVFVGRSFNISCAGLNGDHSQPINLMGTVSPKRDSTLVRDVPR